MTREEVINQYFLEHRAKMIDIAAFLDRVDRAQPTGTGDDYRVRALIEALGLLTDGGGERAKRILDVLSDPSPDPIAASPGKGASGAYAGKSGGEPAS
jgi:hypothetical protein